MSNTIVKAALAAWFGGKPLAWRVALGLGVAMAGGAVTLVFVA